MGEMQEEIFRAMARAEFYPHITYGIEQRETHISRVFLTGKYVYKVKKPKNFGFLDFTTLEKRRVFCNREVELNLRLSRNIYLGVVPITHDGDRFEISGPGRIVEYAVKMNQLPEGRAMNRLLRKGEIEKAMLEELAAILCRFYRRGEAVRGGDSLETVRGNCMENFRQSEPFVGSIIDERGFRLVRDSVMRFLERRRELFVRREKEGMVRDCHGDLRTGHIYFHRGVQIIDCIEFNDRFRYSDSAADLAFLAMDLEFEGFPEISDDLAGIYVRLSGDAGLLRLMNFYKCYRAFVRVKVNCLRLLGGGPGQDEAVKLRGETVRYMALAEGYAADFDRPTLWVVCGMIASGKSTVAAALGSVLEIGVFGSDLLRKEIFAANFPKSGELSFCKGIYSKEATERTYEELLLSADREMANVRSVIINATFAKKSWRMKAVSLAEKRAAHILFVECGARESLIRKRLEAREGSVTVSDARLRHLDHIRAGFEPLDERSHGAHLRIDTEKPLDKNVEEILLRGYTSRLI